jgi:hypothetical protein
VSSAMLTRLCPTVRKLSGARVRIANVAGFARLRAPFSSLILGVAGQARQGYVRKPMTLPLVRRRGRSWLDRVQPGANADR